MTLSTARVSQLQNPGCLHVPSCPPPPPAGPQAHPQSLQRLPNSSHPTLLTRHTVPAAGAHQGTHRPARGVPGQPAHRRLHLPQPLPCGADLPEQLRVFRQLVLEDALVALPLPGAPDRRVLSAPPRGHEAQGAGGRARALPAALPARPGGRTLSVGCRGSPGFCDTPSCGRPHPHGSHLHYVVWDSTWPGCQPRGDGPGPRLLALLRSGDPP